MVEFGDIPGVVVRPVPAEGRGALRVEISRAVETDAGASVAIDGAWTDLCRQNPRLFDGPVLLVDCGALSRGILMCRRAGYKHIATAASIGMNVRALGVQGLVVGHDGDGDECVLMGRRGGETRIYGGLWENAPSGSVPPPVVSQTVVDDAHIIRVLQDEGIQELGFTFSAASATWIALLEDANANSIDVVMRVDVPEPIDPRRVPCPTDDADAWEYIDTAWVPTARIKSWVERSPAALSPPTLGFFRWLGWT